MNSMLEHAYIHVCILQYVHICVVVQLTEKYELDSVKDFVQLLQVRVKCCYVSI